MSEANPLSTNYGPWTCPRCGTHVAARRTKRELCPNCGEPPGVVLLIALAGFFVLALVGVGLYLLAALVGQTQWGTAPHTPNPGAPRGLDISTAAFIGLLGFMSFFGAIVWAIVGVGGAVQGFRATRLAAKKGTPNHTSHRTPTRAGRG